jgi:succinate-semialdehyde dehydrogenase/glutarate-semialdehyde dehydrogenase
MHCNAAAAWCAAANAHAPGASFYPPTVIADATHKMRLASEETFGPRAACFRCSQEQEAIEHANATSFWISTLAI